MPASIGGIIFTDLNQNGIFNPGDPGIPNAYVSLLCPTEHVSKCKVMQAATIVLQV